MSEIDRESILSRLRKLERLATSSNEHEAALAASRYQEILFKYNLTEAEVGVEDDGDDYTQEFTDATGNEGWSVTLLNQIAKANFCSVVKNVGRDRKQVTVIGKAHNIEVVMFLHDYLSKELKRLSGLAWQRQSVLDTMAELNDEYVPQRKKGQFVLGFLIGAVESVGERLREQRRKDEEAAAQSTALVVRFDAELRTAIANFYPNLRHGRRTSYRMDSAGHQAGRQAGSNVGLVQGVKGAGPSKQLRLA